MPFICHFRTKASNFKLNLAGSPVVRKQFAQPGDGVRRDTREDIAEPGEWFDAAPLAGSNEASQHRRRLAAGVAAKECPVAAAHRDIG